MKTTNNTIEYFANVKNIQDVHEVVINNLAELENEEFLLQYRAAYEQNKNKQIGKYGTYEGKTKITADEYIAGIRALVSLEKIRVYENGKRKNDINISIRYSKKYHGVNVSGDTYHVRKYLGEMGFHWNKHTKEWYYAFKEPAKTVDLPKSVTITIAKDEAAANSIVKGHVVAESDPKEESTKHTATKNGTAITAIEKAKAFAEKKQKAISKRKAPVEKIA